MIPLVMEHTGVLDKTLDASSRFVINQGGTRSSKTISIAQALIIKALKEKTSSVYSVVRKTMPALRASAMRDFFNLLKEQGIYTEANHDKSSSTYRLRKVEIEFFGLDEPQKVKGRGRKILWMNEANEFEYEDFMQLNLRTTDQIFMDYNPSDEVHWIYDRILTRDDCTLIESTYLDNPFLDPALKEEIERLKTEDPDHWIIYGLGKIGRRKERVHTNWDLVDEMPLNPDEVIYGLDFGYNNPAALVEVAIKDLEIWVDEKLYETRLTNNVLAQRMNDLVTGKHSQIYADCAEPKSIEEISQYRRPDGTGFDIVPAEKGPDSVNHGIKTVNRYKTHITKRSANVVREIRRYSWKTNPKLSPGEPGYVLDDPVKFHDHSMNALRYAIHTYSIRGALRPAMTMSDGEPTNGHNDDPYKAIRRRTW